MMPLQLCYQIKTKLRSATSMYHSVYQAYKTAATQYVVSGIVFSPDTVNDIPPLPSLITRPHWFAFFAVNVPPFDRLRFGIVRNTTMSDTRNELRDNLWLYTPDATYYHAGGLFNALMQVVRLAEMLYLCIDNRMTVEIQPDLLGDFVGTLLYIIRELEDMYALDKVTPAMLDALGRASYLPCLRDDIQRVKVLRFMQAAATPAMLSRKIKTRS